MARSHTVAGLSTHPEPAVAVGEALGRVVEEVGMAPDLAVVFVSGALIDVIDDVVDTVATLLAPVTLIGSSAVGVIGGSEEVESGSAVSIWAVRFDPQPEPVRVRPVRLQSFDVGAQRTVLGMPSLGPDDALLVLADPFSFPVDTFIQDLALAAPSVPVVGGLASAGRSAGQNRLVLDTAVHDDGAVGVVVPASIVDLSVSQGCRPIGDPWVVTESTGNLIRELAGRPALDRVNELVAELTPEDRALASRGLHIGVVIDEQRERFRAGDFLIRAVLGADPESGAVAIGESVEVGRVVQFQVRDAHSASDELTRLLPPDEADGALVFTCNGRGTRLFPEPHHDASVVQEATLGGVGGMFCAGELGPVGAANAIHGFTATVVWFH